MPRLHHVNIHARDQERMRDFFVATLGMEVGHRPDFGFPGYWLYLDGHPVIHLQDDLKADGQPKSGWVDHVAFGIFDDYRSVLASPQACGHEFEYKEIPETDLGQFFVRGPEGIRIELQCKRPSREGRR